MLTYPNTLDHQNSTNITHSSNFQYDFATSTISSLYPYTQFSNHESLPTLQQSLRSFTTSFPTYLNTVEIDQIRAIEFQNLSKTSHVCLDYIGHALFSFTQVQEQEQGLKISDHSRLKLRRFEVSSLKTRIMKYLNVVQDDYSMFFTTNQTSSFRVLAESYPYKTNKKLIIVYDHENEAIEALIESSKNNGARVSRAEFKWPKLKIHSKNLEEMLVGNGKKVNNKGLFVFPIQSRISGTRYSYQWMNVARENGWHVLLDATSLGPKDMDTLGLSLFQPDFLVCTFYKVFGHDPSGFSCVLVKKSDPLVLNQRYLSSVRGIVTLVDEQILGQQSGICYSEKSNKEIVEGCDIECKTLDHVDSRGRGNNGTQINEIVEQQSGNCYSEKGKSEIIEGCDIECKVQDHVDSLGRGRANVTLIEEEIVEQQSGNCYYEKDIECKALDHADSIGLALIGIRTRCLVNWLANALSALNHPRSNKDVQLVQVYGPRVRVNRGPALAFNVFDWKGEKVDPLLVQKLADRHNISLGHGCLKHLWFSERYEVEKNQVLDKTNKGEIGKFKGLVKDNVKNEIVVITISLSFLTNFEDVYRVWEFVAKFLDADFVEKERWRYIALNKKIISI